MHLCSVISDKLRGFDHYTCLSCARMQGVRAMCLRANSTELITGGSDGTLIAWDITQGTLGRVVKTIQVQQPTCRQLHACVNQFPRSVQLLMVLMCCAPWHLASKLYYLVHLHQYLKLFLGPTACFSTLHMALKSPHQLSQSSPPQNGATTVCACVSHLLAVCRGGGVHALLHALPGCTAWVV